MPTMANTTTPSKVLAFTFPDHLTIEQRDRIGATMRTIFGALVEDARRQRAAVAATR